MGRLVEPRPKQFKLADGSIVDSPPQPRQTIREFTERVARYVPAELLACYVAALNLISAVPEDQTAKRLWLFGIVGLFFWIVTPIWLARYSTDIPYFPEKARSIKRINQCMGFFAFGVWAYAYPAGFFFDIGMHDPITSGVILIIFTVISGLVQPKA